jgi:hypothetical protein
VGTPPANTGKCAKAALNTTLAQALIAPKTKNHRADKGQTSGEQTDEKAVDGLVMGCWARSRKWDPRIEARLCAVHLIFISYWPRARGHSELSKPTQGSTVKLLIDLFSTDYGLMSLAVIVVTLLMGAFFLRMFLYKMNHNE